MAEIEVVKITSKLHLDEDKANIIMNIGRKVAADFNNKYVFVVSGAIVLGAKKCGLSYDELQVQKKELGEYARPILNQYLRVGQPELMDAFKGLINKYMGTTAMSQVLFRYDDLIKGNGGMLRDALLMDLKGGIIPLLNRDATLDSCTENKDNDEPGALVAKLIGAKRYTMLTEEEGLFKDYKNKRGFVDKIDVSEINQYLACCGASNGNGGMTAKLKAAAISAEAGIETIIASYKHPLWKIHSGDVRSTRIVCADKQAEVRKV